MAAKTYTLHKHALPRLSGIGSVPLPVHTGKVRHAGIMKEDLNASWPELIAASKYSLLSCLMFVAQAYVKEYDTAPCVT